MWVIFALLDPDPDSESGSGSTEPIESGSNPDPQPWIFFLYFLSFIFCEVGALMTDAQLLLQQAASTDGPGLVSILIEGAPNAGTGSLTRIPFSPDLLLYGNLFTVFKQNV